MTNKIICRIKNSFPYIRLRGFLHSTGIIKPKEPKDYYISKVSKDAPWIYVSYIAEVFYHIGEENYFLGHQNKRETVRIVKVLNELGYNVYIQNYLSKRELPELKDVRMVFGHEPNLLYAAEKYKGALVVQYNTGAYVEHANAQIIKMTDYVNDRYKSKIPYRRMINTSDKEHSLYKGYEISDKILQIGSKFTIQTMPQKYHKKIITIHQSTQECCDIKVCDAKDNEYLYIGSTGTMLKGVPLLIEYFTNHADKTIHIVGPIEEEYLSLVRDEVTSNLVFHGYMNVHSEEFVDIIKKCNFIVYPSGTEGGVPGAVLCAMKYGLIPIVTPWAAFDEIEEYGYLMDYNWNVESIEKGISWSMSMNPETRLRLKIKCKCFAEKYYNIERFTEEFRAFCIDTLKL